MRKRFVSLLLVLCMVLTLVPTTAFAVEEKVQTPSATNPFTDVKEGDWCYDAVQYARMNGFFNGTSTTQFTPNGTMTRAMFVTVLGRMAGVDTELYEDEKPFSDVPSRMYYAPYVAWAYKHGITGGTGDGKFSPDDLINRQQMATFFVRYFEAFDVDYETGANITTVPADMDSVAPYAKEAVLKLWKQGLLNGDGTNFNPAGNATRAQAATMTMRTDKAVETWYKEPGVASDRVSIDPETVATETPAKPSKPSRPSKPSGGNSGSGDSGEPADPNDPAVTGECRVTFALGNTVSATGVTITLGEEEAEKNLTLPAKKLYPVDTRISDLPTPFKENGIFVGWFYDEAMTKSVQDEDKLDKNLTLYAKMADGEPVAQQELATFATTTVPAENVSKYTFSLKATETGASLNDAIESFLKVSGGNAAMVKVAANAIPEAGEYKIDSNGKVVAGFEQGHNYRVVLKEDAKVEFVLDGAAQGESVRNLSIITEKEEVQNLNLASGIKYLPRVQVSDMTGVALDGLFSVGTAARSGAAQNKNEGTFVFTGSKDYYGNSVQVGNTVAIYEGKVPNQRNAVNMTRADEIGNEGAVAYVEIYKYDEATQTYYYRTADTEDVLFTPDIIPIAAAADKDQVNNQVTVDNALLVFNTADYQKMGLTANTVVEPGDYVALYTGEWGAETSDVSYGCITDVTENTAAGTTVIKYTSTTQEKVFESMDIYTSRNEKVELTEAEKKLIEDNIAENARASGFLEEAAEYLTALAIETDGFKELSDDLDLDLTAYNIVFDDGTLDPETMDLMALKAEIDDDETDVKVNVVAGDLTHFKDGELPLQGLRLELVMSFAVSIKSGDTEKMRIEMQAIFEQEVLLSINVSGGAVWKWAWIIPYLYDYNMNANLDVGTYTGIGITATAKTVAPEDEEDDKKDDKKDDDKAAGDFDWKEIIDATSGALNKTDETIGEVKSAYERITNIGDEIKELMETKQELFRLPNKTLVGDGESAGTVEFKSLEERYAEMMEEAEECWVPIVEEKIFESDGFVDPFHILVYGISADFVVSANLYITMGMTFEYEVAKRYNFSLMLFHGKVTNETIDLVPEHYQFDFYVMGTAGIRAGIEFEIEMGLFCLELDSIGISAELGAYAQLWGYFYYHLEWAKGEGKQSTCSGALAIEIGAYLSVKFKAQMLSMDKLTYNPTLYEDEFPILTIGSIENIRDFHYQEDDDILEVTMNTVKTIELPTELFEMAYMDMKTGELHGGEDDDEPINYDDETESRFIITLSNPKFKYNPATNMISVNVDIETETYEACQMTITWGGAPLAFTSDSLSRMVNIVWTNPAGLRSITFVSEGGTYIPPIVLGFNERINKGTAPEGEEVHYPGDPVRQGFEFKYWYQGSFENVFEIPDIMPDYPADGDWGRGVVVRALWEARDDTPYTVKHYVEQANGTFEHVGTDNLQGTTMKYPTEAEINAVAAQYDDENHYLAAYTNYYIQPDGSTVIELYYRRETFTVTVDYHKDALKGIPVGATDPLYITGKYGSEVIVPTLSFEGCKFNGYTAMNGAPALREVKQEDGTVYYVAKVEGNATYRAKWEMKNDIPYRVEHYVQQDNGDYKLAENGVEYKFGETNARVYAEDHVWSADKLPADVALRANNPYRVDVYGLNTYDEYEDQVVAADGSTIIKIFYDQKSYGVEYIVDGDTYHEVTIKYGELIPKPWTDPTVPLGKTFSGWYTKNADGSWGNKLNVGSVYLNDLNMLDQNGKLTLYARFGITEYTVRYDLGEFAAMPEGVTNPTTVTVESGNVALKQPVKTGHEFIGWTGSNGTEPELFVTFNPGMMTNAQLNDLHYTANWQKNSYTITYYNNDMMIEKVSVPYGDPVPEKVITKDGWHFDGWFYNDGQTMLYGTMPAKDLIVEAKWSREKYNIFFDAVGGSAVDPIYQVEYESAMPELPTPTKPGYQFKGWTLDKRPAPTTMPNRDITLTASWTPNTYTITFDTDGGSTVNPIMALYNTAVSAPANPTKEGYSFVKWDPALPAKMPVDGLEVKAIWQINQYTITFDSDGGSQVAPITQNYGTKINAPAAPTKANYTFDGWENLPETMPAENLTVKAKWKGVTYQISYEGVEDTTGYPTEYVYGIATTIPNPTKPGYEFTGWQINGSGSKISLILYPGDVTADVTLTATWKAGNSTFTVNHYWQKTKGEGYDLHKKFTATGKTGEMTNVTAEQYTGLNAKFFDQQTIQADGTTKVDIYYDRIQYQVTFDLGDAATLVETTIDPVTARYGATIDEPVAPTFQECKLSGWYYRNSQGILTRWDFSATTVTADTELIAMWEEADEANYTINYYEMDLNGEYPTAPTRSENGSAYIGVKVTATAAEGFTMDTAHEGHVAEGTMSATGLTLNVYLSRNKYKLTVKPGNGQANTEKEYYYGAPLELPELTRAGYTFKGWDGESENMPAKHHTLNAVWEGLKFTVKFVANLPTGVSEDKLTGTMADQRLTFGPDAKLQTNAFALTGTGYGFKGWNTAADGSGTDFTNGAVFNMAPESDGQTITLYAQWVKGKTVTYDVRHHIMNTQGKYCNHEIVSRAKGTQYGFAEILEIEPDQLDFWCTKEECGGYDFEGNEQHFTMVLPESLVIEYDYQIFDVYYTRNRYELTMDPDTGTMPAGTTLPDGTTLTAPSSEPFVVGEYYFNQNVTVPTLNKNPERSGYTFTAWATADNTWSGKMDSAGLVLVPVFQPARSEVYFWIAGNQWYTTLSGATDAPLTMPAAPKRDGYTFLGWDQTFDKFPAGGANVYALWEAKEYKITFNANKPPYEGAVLSGTMAPVSGYKYYTDQALPANQYEVTAYSFKGWNTKADGTGISVSDMGLVGTTVMGDFATDELVLYAQWEQKTWQTIVITFQLMDTNGEYQAERATTMRVYDGMKTNIEEFVRNNDYIKAHPEAFILDGVDYNVVLENFREGANGWMVVDTDVKIARRQYNLEWEFYSGYNNTPFPNMYVPNEGEYSSGSVYYGAKLVYPEEYWGPDPNYKDFKYTYINLSPEADQSYLGEWQWPHYQYMPAHDVKIRMVHWLNT